jgi:hypothetical protein
MMTVLQNDLHDRSRIFAEDTRAEGSPPYPHKQPESQRVWAVEHRKLCLDAASTVLR